VKPTNRAGVHQLFTIFTAGLGTLAGNLLAGFVSEYDVSATGATNFRIYWLVCLIIVIAASLCLVFFFKSRENGHVVTADPQEPGI
jgi:MFS family permease